MSDELLTLYRPVGHAEFDLIRAAGFRRFPTRLAGQPIFYPVLDRGYAEQIARDWNAPDPACGHVGYVLRFHLPTAHAARYPVRTVGDRTAKELWVPAEELAALNDAIIGLIEVVAEFRGCEINQARAEMSREPA